MNEAFGTNFVMVNDAVQVLDPKVFGGGPWIHLATVVRGFKEYMCFRHQKTGQVYLEEVDSKDPNLLSRIKDDNEFEDLQAFIRDTGVLTAGMGHEIKIAKPKR